MKNFEWISATVFSCILAALCEGVDLQAAGVAAAGIAAEFKPLPAQLGTFFSASTFGLLLGALIGGWLSDRRGRKGILVLSVAAFGIFSVLTALADNIMQLAWARFFTGFGLGGALPNLLALVSECSPERSKQANLTLVYAAMPAGGALVSLIAMSLPSSSWRLLFITGGMLPLIAVPLMMRYLEESPVFERRAVQRVFGDSRRAGGGFVNLFAERRLLSTLLLWISFFLGLLILYLLLNWLPTLLIGRGMRPGVAAAAQIAFNAGGATAAIGLGRLLDGANRLMVIALIGAAMPLLVWWLAASSSTGLIVLLPVLLIGCTVLALQAFLNASAPALYPNAVRGLGVGVAVAIGRLGAVVGPKLGGIWKGEGLDTSQLLFKLLPIVLLASVCSFALAMVSARERG